MTAVYIQILEEKDSALARQVWQLREEVLRQPLGLSLRDEDLSEEAEDITFFACTDSGEMLGCLMLRPLSTCALKLRQMAVRENAQGQGIGRKLVETAEAYALAKGFYMISLHARQHAIPFYERLGYEAEGATFIEVGIPHRLMKKTR